MDTYQDLEQKIKELDISVRSLRKTGAEYGRSYAEYRMKLAKKLLEEKDRGTPATLATDIARGDGEVAKAKEQEICNEAIYLANKEAINATKLQIKILVEQYNQDWGKAKYD